MIGPAPKNRQELLAVFSQVGAQFEGVREEIRHREDAIRIALKKVKTASDENPLRDSNLPENHPLRQVAMVSSTDIKTQLVAWVADVANYDQGTKFHERFGDSLLIFVYGKVKAGKSSLGNYLAYGNHQPSDQLVATAEPKPNFFWEIGTGKNEDMNAALMKERQRFGVAATEATSSIQGFTLPGLTWIDSPGVHSMTKVNGELAEKYAGFADLVVYLCNSSNPGRRSDMAEISDLLKKGKSLVVLLTASDVVDEDEDDEGQVVQRLVMKSEKDRHDQVTYVQDELAALAPELRKRLLDVRVFPVSISYVEGGMQAERWQESGMAAFAERIANIAGEQALAIKRETPLRNLMDFCENLGKSIEKVDGQLTAIRSQLEEEREQMRREGNRILTTMRKELTNKVEKLADKYAMDDAGFAAACSKEIDDCLRRHSHDLFAQLGESLENTMSQVQAVVPLDSDLPGFSKRTKKCSYESNINEKRGKAGGALAGTLAGARVGGFAGPWGVAVGAMIGGIAGYVGGALGGFAGKQLDSADTMEIDIGDNRQEVSLATRKQLVERAARNIDELCQQLDKLCFANTEAWLLHVSQALHDLRKEAKFQKIEIEKELSVPKNNKGNRNVTA